MASSAPKIAPPERRDALEVIDKQADELVALITKSKHFIVFTGAGVSTSAGIPDFRGPEGAWTLKAQGRARTSKATSTLQAIPTPTHMALVELENQGVLKYLVSQNCDGLHRRSGILRDRISELHGNSNHFRAVASYEKTVHDHRTGRKCTACGGNLHDTIINFGEFLPEEPLKLARSHAKKADLCLALGSSLSVPPASGIPETCGKSKKSKLIICNLQETFMEPLADMHVWSESDVLMTRVMDKLGYTIPSFILKRRLVIKMERDAHDRQVIILTGVDNDVHDGLQRVIDIVKPLEGMEDDLKSWQGYQQAIEQALQLCVSSEVASSRRDKETLRRVEDTQQQQELKAQEAEKAQEKQVLLDFLSQFDTHRKHLDMVKIRHPETRFQQEESTLWCHGIPGCGKTVIFSRIVDRLPTHCHGIIASVYLSYKDPLRNDPDANLRALLRQAVDQLEGDNAPRVLAKIKVVDDCLSAQILINSGVACDAKDNKGRTQVHIAAACGSDDANVVSTSGQTPLHYALQVCPKAVLLLLHNGASITSKSHNGRGSFHWACLSKLTDNELTTPLHILAAVHGDHSDTASWHLKRGANPDLQDNDGFTPLHIA
ncbi:NAD-dependent deacetylase sirtuin-6 [Fusarium austroafricanum]|uniref:protein acetyllysine N-acetyltransferase n=1 Tax=Fusarium austroafricanum TaxID=2364996 RepID=A0A8H4NSF1_9HYPO|nr:NAD-dependent deacetylase sirtuin-6 [Fusarium austroafricanum]